MPPERNRVEELWEREVGGLPPKRFSNAVIASEGFVRSLTLQKKLRKHKCSVNSISFSADGRLLLSGSDDQTVVLWNWEEEVPVSLFAHRDMVMNAQFVPFSDNRSIVSCSADGEVTLSRIREGGGIARFQVAELEHLVYRLAVEPESPHTFYGCTRDGSVWLFDLRGEDTMEIIGCSEVKGFYSMAIDPGKPSCLAVAGSDQFVRIYDTRKIDLDDESYSFAHPIEHFCPPHLIGKRAGGITGVAYSQTGELLASYSDDNIYLFTREDGLQFNNIEVDGQLLMYGTKGACSINTPPLLFSGDKLPVPKAFKGHKNTKTLTKEVNFLGPNCDYVTSGSEGGNGYIFIWRKKDGELIRVMRGDIQDVKCVQQHPSGIVVASSGIGNTIKIWEPEGEDPSSARFNKDEEEMSPFSNSESDGDWW